MTDPNPADRPPVSLSEEFVSEIKEDFREAQEHINKTHEPEVQWYWTPRRIAAYESLLLKIAEWERDANRGDVS